MAITSSFKHLRQKMPPTNPALVTLTESTLNKMIEAKCAEFRVLCKAEEEDTANAINLLLAAVLGQSFITDYSELTEKATEMYKEEMDKFMQTSFIPWEVLGRKHDKVVESCVRGLWGGIPPGKRAEFSE
uniref:Uncharacterized protein n=1 Tax=Ciona savignyi TaxID=51511 RepID=H2Y610_CIOSA